LKILNHLNTSETFEGLVPDVDFLGRGLFVRPKRHGSTLQELVHFSYEHILAFGPSFSCATTGVHGIAKRQPTHIHKCESNIYNLEPDDSSPYICEYKKKSIKLVNDSI